MAFETFVELLPPAPLVRGGGKAGLEAVVRQLPGVLRRQAGGGEHGLEVVVHVAAEIGRIVRVHGGAQAGVEQRLQIVVAQLGEHAQLLVRQRAHGERYALGRQALRQRGVVHRLHAVVDALDTQHIQRLPDVFGRAFLAGVGHQTKAQFAAAREHAGELFRRMAEFA